MRGCTLNKKKDCTYAKFEDYKQSDITKLGAGLRILKVLIHEQPLKRVDLIKKAKIAPSTFSRYRRRLLNEKVIKVTPDGYALYNFIFKSSFWDEVKQICSDSGGQLIDLDFKKLVLGEQKSTPPYHYEVSYYDSIIQGIMIHKGALNLRCYL